MAFFDYIPRQSVAFLTLDPVVNVFWGHLLQ
jgi:hypothetical protein